MKKFCLFIIMLFSSIMVVDANSISNIDMNIFVDDYGNAHVEEIWNVYANEGTELYHPYFNLGNSFISDLRVTMDGEDFTTVSNWDINNSFGTKSYKAGIYNAGNGEVDVCLGISVYGGHVYNIKYKVNNFVSTVNDADMIYWNLFPYNFNPNPSNVNIKIYSDFRYDDTLDVWGYGKYGAPTYVYDGKIEMTSDGLISSDEYLTILVKFDKGTFNTSSVLDNDFNYYYNMAEKGAVSYSDKTSLLSKIFVFVFTILGIGIILIVSVIVKNNAQNDKLDFGKTGNKVRKDVPYFREIPCNKDMFYAFWVTYNYNLMSFKENFLGCILLKWMHDGNVKLEKSIRDGLFKDKEVSNIVFVSRPNNDNKYEGKLYDYMNEASKDGKLESKEFENWCKSNYSKIFNWFDDVLDNENLELCNIGKVVRKDGKTFGVMKYKYFEVDPSMMEEAEKVAGLKKFLKEFTLIKERQPIEVSLWNEYLMFAQMFGIADEVAKQFKELYPEIITNMDSLGYDYGDIIFINTVSRNGIRSADTARNRARSYSSGGGGFSSGGGGIGSFGGGGGGGGIR